MPNFAQNSVLMSSMATKKYIWAYFRRKSMDLGPNKILPGLKYQVPPLLVNKGQNKANLIRWNKSCQEKSYSFTIFGKDCLEGIQKSWRNGDACS